jgi:hypothetical protein
MKVESISGNTLTVTRGIHGTTKAIHADDSIVYIYPQTLPEYVTTYTETNTSSDAEPTPLHNYGQCFFFDFDYSELLDGVYKSNRQKGMYTPEQAMQEKLRDMKARMEMKAILGIPHLTTSTSSASGMGGLKYYVEQAGQNVAVTGDLKRTSFNAAMKALDRAGGTADWVLMNSDEWEIISEGWGEQRIIQQTTTTAGHVVDAILTAYGLVKIRPMHDFPAKTLIFGNSGKVKMGACNGKKLARFERMADAGSTINRLQWRGWYTLQATDIARSFCKLTYTGSVDTDGV